MQLVLVIIVAFLVTRAACLNLLLEIILPFGVLFLIRQALVYSKVVFDLFAAKV
jgi:hypothetical protein